MINYNEEDEYTEETAYLRYQDGEVQWSYKGELLVLAELRTSIWKGEVLNVRATGDIPSNLESTINKKIEEVKEEISSARGLVSSRSERGYF